MNCNNVCTNTTFDPLNCGGCGTKCGAPANETAACVNSKCGYFCTDPFKDCNNNVADGCEINSSNNASNCGACGKVCSLPNATSNCTNSSCAVASCNANFGNCDGVAANGCEASLLTDANNCGVCGKSCGGQACTNGSCGKVCDAATEVTINGKCCYLDGSGGKCDAGYSMASQALLSNGKFNGKNYKHQVSGNCCIWNADADEDYGMQDHCNAPGPFTAGDPTAGAIGCTNQFNHGATQLTFCCSN